MLRTRLWMGSILIGLAVGVLILDRHFEPWYPFLFALLMLLAGIACFELTSLLPPERRPIPWLSYAAVGLILSMNWLVHVPLYPSASERDAWHWLAGAVAGVTLATFVLEMARFREPGETVTRIALTLFTAYTWACFLASSPKFAGSPAPIRPRPHSAERRLALPFCAQEL